MPVFNLPIAATNETSLPSAQVHFSTLSLRQSSKRKRDGADSDEEEKLDLWTPDNTEGTRRFARNIALENTNPLSLTPAEVVQYRLAGLELDKETPDKEGVKGWPHRGVPEPDENALQKTGDIDEDEEEEERRAKEKKKDRKKTGNTNLRIQHLSVLVAMMMRCLEEGDMERAGKAWALLLRTEIGGRAIEVRKNGYWGIGAELLMRGRENRKTLDENDEEGDEQIEGDDYDARTNENKEEGGSKRWGTEEGLYRAKHYYERLILQYPYKRQFHNAVTALDFWPAMLGCEIYGIQYERTEDLRKLAEGNEDDFSGSDEGEPEEEIEDEGPDAEFEAHERREALLGRRKEDRRWEKKEKIRMRALKACQGIASRMDSLMTHPPYSDSIALLRLRGMLALYIGDLVVPEKWEDGSDDGESHRKGNVDRRFLARQRQAELRRGKDAQAEERLRAKNLFRRIGEHGVDVGEWGEDGADGTGDMDVTALVDEMDESREVDGDGDVGMSDRSYEW